MDTLLSSGRHPVNDPGVLLDVRDLRIHFRSEEGVVRAVDGVSFQLRPGETLGLVGESGCGKTVSALAILKLLEVPPAQYCGGEILFDGRDLLKTGEKDMRQLRGKVISMIFQEPMTSLNPVISIGSQVGEVLTVHQKMRPREARGRTVELLSMVGISSPRQRLDDYPHQLSGGMRPAACGSA